MGKRSPRRATANRPGQVCTGAETSLGGFLNRTCSDYHESGTNGAAGWGGAHRAEPCWLLASSPSAAPLPSHTRSPPVPPLSPACASQRPVGALPPTSSGPSWPWSCWHMTGARFSGAHQRPSLSTSSWRGDARILEGHHEGQRSPVILARWVNPSGGRHSPRLGQCQVME